MSIRDQKILLAGRTLVLFLLVYGIAALGLAIWLEWVSLYFAVFILGAGTFVGMIIRLILVHLSDII